MVEVQITILLVWTADNQGNITKLISVKNSLFLTYCHAWPKLVQLQVNAFSDWIIGIYLYSFTNIELEIFNTALGKASIMRYWNFSFIVSELVQVNPVNSRAMSVLTLFFIIQIEYTAQRNRQTLSQPKPWGNDCGVLNLQHGYYTTLMTSRRLFRHNPVSCGTNQPIIKTEFVQYMTVE